MPKDQSAGPRDTLLAIALVGVVAACGAAGIYFSKEVSHAATVAPGAAPVTSAPAERSHMFAPVRPAARQPVVPKPVSPDDGEANGTPAVANTSADETPGQVTDDKEVGLALGRWQTAMLTNDSAEIAPSYAPHVNRFFLQAQVSRAYVRDYLERDEERGTRLTRYDMQDVSIKHLKPDEVQVDFRANFAVSTPDKDRAGNAKTMLILKRLEGDWKIVYERDFKS